MAQSLVNESGLRALFVALSTTFNDALLAITQDYKTTCMEVPSTGRGMDYAWLTRFPMMRQWIGDKQVKNLALITYYVPNVPYEATIAVDRDDVEDDQLGIYKPQAESLAQTAADLYPNIANHLKNNAFTDPAFDKVPFYGSHSLTDAAGIARTYSNAGVAVLSSANFAAANGSLGAARVALMKMCDHEGSPLGLMPDTLEVPPALEAQARILTPADKLGDNSPNPFQGTCKVIVNPGLTSDTAWFLHVTSRTIKPFIIQIREAPNLVSQVNPDSDSVYNRRQFLYGLEARCAGAYGFWQLSFGSTGAGA